MQQGPLVTVFVFVGRATRDSRESTESHAWPLHSVQRVKSLGTARHHLLARGFREAGELLTHHGRSAGKKAVRVRIVGGPEDFVRADIFSEHSQAALDGLERDPAIALEDLARTHGKTGIVEPFVIEMPVHPL